MTVRDREGIPVSGALQATIAARAGVTDLEGAGGPQRVTYEEVAAMGWTKPPYVVPFVPSGDYLVRCFADFAQRLNIDYAGPFEFRPGPVTSIELRATR